MNPTLQTLENLPGEGEIRIRKQVQTRRECEECGEPAHLRYTFLLPNARANPASSAYGRDDCSWCSDLEIFVCKDCPRPRHDGYVDCAIFAANERFAHMFLRWKDAVVGRG